MRHIRMRDGAELHVRVIGSGKPILLLHGFAMHSLHWLPFALPLSLKNQIIIPDLRGFGRSHHVPFNQSCVINNYIEDLEDLRQALQLPRFKMAGISMGALTGLSYLTAHEEHVTHYLHIDQAPRCMNNAGWKWGLFGKQNPARMESASILLNKLLPYVEQKTPFKHVPNVLKQRLWRELGEFFADAFSNPLQKRLARGLCQFPRVAAKFLPTDNWSVYVLCLRAYIQHDYDLLPKLGNIQSPISLLVGMKSDMYPCGGQLRMADHLPNCNVIAFEKSGHAPLIDEPLKFMNTLSELAAA